MYSVGLKQTELLFRELAADFKRQLSDFTTAEPRAAFCTFREQTRAYNDDLLTRITGEVILSNLRFCLSFEPRHPKLLTGLLSVYVRFGVRADARPYTIYAVLPFCAPDDFHSWTLTGITTKKQLEAGIAHLLSLFMQIYDAADALALDSRRLHDMDSAFRDDVNNYFNEDIFAIFDNNAVHLESCLERYRDALTRRLCSRRYQLFMLGNYASAYRAYHTRERLLGVSLMAEEERICAFLKALVSSGGSYDCLPRELWFFMPETREEDTIVRGAQTRSVFIGGALTYAAIVLVSGLIFFGLQGVLAQGCEVALFSSPAGLLVFSLPPAMLLTLLYRHSFYHIFARRSETALLEKDDFPPDAVRIWGSRAIVAVCLIFTVFYSNCSLKFFDGGMIDNRSFGSLSGRYYRYSEVQLKNEHDYSVLYCDGRQVAVLNRLTSSRVIEQEIAPLLE